jgi:uncharacterized protein involved in exopolysaccharide biosynthesis
MSTTFKPSPTTGAAQSVLQPSAKLRVQSAWPYFRGATLSVVLVWSLVSVYLALTPRMYASRWTLNVPGASNSVSFSLESIGQTSSTPTSPFATSALSPKVVYKEIADSETVRLMAAEQLGLSLKDFGRPRIKLIDETALMLFEIAGPTPEAATLRARALIVAFNTQLDGLRNDELEKREAAIRQNLAAYQAEVKRVRDLQREAQGRSGLASTTQFAEMVSSMTTLRRRVVDLEGEMERVEHERQSLMERLRLTPAQASLALKIASDTSMQKAFAELSEAVSLEATDAAKYGPRHPQRLQSATRMIAARGQLDAQLAVLGIERGDDVSAVMLAMNATHRAELLQSLVKAEAHAQGKRHEISIQRAEQKRLEADVSRLTDASVRLEELKKDQIVADAVLSSALARINASRSDIFGSYPIVQVVAQPDKTEYLSQPRMLYAGLGGLSGSVFACLAWFLAWLQFVHRSRRQKNASFIGP